MRNTKMTFLFVILLVCAFSEPTFGQQRVFNWLPGNDESVRLDPANYHAGPTYHAAGNGGNIQVDIKAELPVTIFLAPPGSGTQRCNILRAWTACNSCASESMWWKPGMRVSSRRKR